MIAHCRELLIAVPAVLIVAGGVVAAAPGDETAEASRPVQELVDDLSSTDFRARRRATGELLRAGPDAVKPLLRAAATRGPEVQRRVVQILRHMFVAGKDDSIYEPAETALETLSRSSNGALAARAERVLGSYGTLRLERAREKVEQLGGIIDYHNIERHGVIVGNRSDPTRRLISHVVLGSRWKGGDEGLKYVKRLLESAPRNGPTQRLYVAKTAKSSPVSPEAEAELKAALPHVDVEERSQAYLGVGGRLEPHPEGCPVLEVKPGAAAAQAGIRELDIITHFGGKRVRDFDSLIESIKQYAPGDKVEVQVLRGSETKTLEVTMGEWSASE